MRILFGLGSLAAPFACCLQYIDSFLAYELDPLPANLFRNEPRKLFFQLAVSGPVLVILAAATGLAESCIRARRQVHLSAIVTLPLDGICSGGLAGLVAGRLWRRYFRAGGMWHIPSLA